MVFGGRYCRRDGRFGAALFLLEISPTLRRTFLDRLGRREAARGWHSLIRRRERKELRPWRFISALGAGDDGVVVIVHRHRYVRLPTLRTAASDGYDHIFGHITLQAQNALARSSDNVRAGARSHG